MTDGTGTTTYSYDAMGDVTSQALSAGSGFTSNTVGHTYFSTGDLASTIYPNYGSYRLPAVNYTYDALGNMASETDWLGNEVAFGHDGDGNLTSQDNVVSGSYPNGTSSTTFAYDNADYNSSASTSMGGGCGLTQSYEGSPGSRNADGQVTEDYETFTGSGGCWAAASLPTSATTPTTPLGRSSTRDPLLRDRARTTLPTTPPEPRRRSRAMPRAVAASTPIPRPPARQKPGR